MGPDRFWSKVRKSAGCWSWTGFIDKAGYGRLKRQGVVGYAHRISYEIAHGPIEPGLVIDHLCRKRACVNPSHLELVTNRTNVTRGVNTTMAMHLAGVCKRGHRVGPTNTLFRDNGTVHTCLACQRERRRAWRPERGRRIRRFA